MIRRWSIQTWVLIGLAGVVALPVIEAAWRAGRDTNSGVEPHSPAPGSRETSTRGSTPESHGASSTPTGLRAGTKAPEFTLTDIHGRPRRLSEYEGKRIVLQFFCGCSRCFLMVTAMQEIEERIPGEKPHDLAVVTMATEALSTWQRETEYSGTILLEEKRGPVISRYQGEPCPRVYVLDRQLLIKHVSPSPNTEASAAEILGPIARALGSTWAPSSGSPDPASPKAGSDRL